MPIIDRGKALHNLSFGDERAAVPIVTTLHPDGEMTSGGYEQAATTIGVHDLELKEDIGVSTTGLKALLSNIDADAPEIIIEGNVLSLKTPRSRYSIGLCDPRLKPVQKGIASAEELDGSDPAVRKILKRFAMFASKELGKEHMQSLFFSPTGICSLDGYQIANANIPLAKVQNKYSIHASHITHALKSFPDEFKIRFTEGRSFIYDHETRWQVCAIEGEIKDYPNLIPKVEFAQAKINYSQELLDAVKAVSKATPSSDVFISVGMNVVDVSANIDITSARESVECKCIVSDPLEMRFNSKMLINILAAGLEFHESPDFHLNIARQSATVTALNSSFTAMGMKS